MTGGFLGFTGELTGFKSIMVIVFVVGILVATVFIFVVRRRRRV